MKALPEILLALTAVAALSVVYPASVQAVPTTYQYTGNPFIFASGEYTMSDFVTAMVTFNAPLQPNTPFHEVHPTAFTFFDGVQTITNLDIFPSNEPPVFIIATGDTGIREWLIELFTFDPETQVGHRIDSANPPFFIGGGFLADIVISGVEGPNESFAQSGNHPGTWTGALAAPDAGSTLSLMTLTLMALGLVARRFQRAAG